MRYIDSARKKNRENKEWSVLRNEADLGARLASACGWDRYLANFLFLLAQAQRALGDNLATISAYEGVINAATKFEDNNLLAGAYDNLGNALVDEGRYDEALLSYQSALHIETNPKGRLTILVNRSNAYMALGELRKAVQTLKGQIDEVEKVGANASERAYFLDNLANSIAQLGDFPEALKLFHKARTLLTKNDFSGRAVNALGRAQIYLRQEETLKAGKAFMEAYDLALEDARHLIGMDHYRRGFINSHEARLPKKHEAYKLLIEGLAAKEKDRWEIALKLFRRGTDLAQKGGDVALRLRIEANAAALLADAGQVGPAIILLTKIQQQASKQGLAQPELMAWGTLESLAATGVNIHMKLGPLGALARSLALQEVHEKIVGDLGLSKAEIKFETYDPGTIALGLALLAEKFHADDCSIKYYRAAVHKAKESSNTFILANRLSGLRFILERTGHVQEADQIAQNLADVLKEKGLPDRTKLVSHKALGTHHAVHNRQKAIKHFQKARSMAEKLRKNVPQGKGRADVGRQYRGIYRSLARLLMEDGNGQASFDVLQGDKARRLIDALANTKTEESEIFDQPTTVDEVSKLVAQLGDEKPSVLVDLLVDNDRLDAYLIGKDFFKTLSIPGTLSDLSALEYGDICEREARLLKCCMEEGLLRDLAEAVIAMVPKASRLLIVPDQFLHNFPLHVIPVRGRPWGDHTPIGYLAAAGTLRFSSNQRKPVGRSLIAGDSREDLPHARKECVAVGTVLNAKPLLGQKCTRAAIEEILQSREFDIIHLAIHGRGDVRQGGRASLLLANGTGGTEWVAFEDLAAFRWRANLVVFSGCSTAVSGLRHGDHLVGVARAAREAGATTVIGCLWPVGDEEARVFMKGFYRELGNHLGKGPIDLRLILDKARKTLRTWFNKSTERDKRRRDGRDLEFEGNENQGERKKGNAEHEDVHAWGPFILLGDPIFYG